MKKQITLLDPSISNSDGIPSANLGDIIIADSVLDEMVNLFPDYELVRISTHTYLNKKDYENIKKSEYTFIGGTNLLSSNIREYNQWKVSLKKGYYLFPNLKNIVLLGVGWWQYQHNPTLITKLFYRKALGKYYLHSVRDEYTKSMLSQCGRENILNTSCPTTWGLGDYNPIFDSESDILFTLTDYNQDVIEDNKLLELILKSCDEKIYFFPQGYDDTKYLNSLNSFKKNSSRITILDYRISEFNNLIYRNRNIRYIGTRLHGGIRCMQNNIPSLIIAIDNRAIEISKDINIPIVKRTDYDMMKLWLEGNFKFPKIELPHQSIKAWREQFFKV